MKYTLLLVSIVALFICAAHAAPEPNNNMPGTGKKDAEIEGLMKRLKEDLAEAQNTGDDGGSIESFADEQQGPGVKELEKIMEAEVQDENDGMEQADDGALLQGDGPGELQKFSLAQGDDTATAQWRYYRYYVYYYRLYCRWRHYYYNLLRYYKIYRHHYLTYRRLYYRCVHNRHG